MCRSCDCLCQEVEEFSKKLVVLARSAFLHGTPFRERVVSLLSYELLKQAMSALADLIVAAEHFNKSCENTVQFAHRNAKIFFEERLPLVGEEIQADLQVALDADPAAKSDKELVLCYPGIEALIIFRAAHALLLLGVPLIPRMMTEYAHARTGIDIHPGARIKPGFFIDHGTGVVIGETCDIGRNVKLYQGVTLGAFSFPRDADGNIIRGMKRHPTLEDEVVVYANATILGGDTVIGHHAVIGSNVFITQSVAPDTVVSLEKPSLRIRQPGASAPQAPHYENAPATSPETIDSTTDSEWLEIIMGGMDPA